MYPPYPQWHIELAQAVVDSFCNRRPKGLFTITESSEYKGVEYLPIHKNWKSFQKWDNVIETLAYAIKTFGVDREERIRKCRYQALRYLKVRLPLQSIEAAAILSEWQTKHCNKIGV